MKNPYTYQVQLTWLESRKGLLQSDVLDATIEVATPPEFAKGIIGIWSPEHLFVAAVTSCVMTTFLALAEKSRLKFIHFKCNAIGILEKKEDKLMVTKITVSPILTIANKGDFLKGIKVLELTEKSCIISNSIKSELIFFQQVKVENASDNK